MIGDRFGRLLVIGSDGRQKSVVRCDCGVEKSVRRGNLGRTTMSCGCLRSETSRERGLNKISHRLTLTPEHHAWVSMRQRCTKPSVVAYKNYGGRGIKVCERWEKFDNFIKDMGMRPSSDHSLDRVDVNGNYEPSNCRWATSLEQARNRRPRGEWDASSRGSTNGRKYNSRRYALRDVDRLAFAMSKLLTAIDEGNIPAETKAQAIKAYGPFRNLDPNLNSLK